MYIKEQLSKMTLPKIYQREGKECFYDPFRKKLIVVTPEEIVRQKVAVYCVQALRIPHDMIGLELPMSYYIEKQPGRADIIIHQIAEDNIQYPICVIECKNEDVFLSDKVAEQAMQYCDIVGAKYFIITNGIDLQMAVYNESDDRYYDIDGVLSYGEMLDNQYKLTDINEEPLKRFTLQELNNMQLIKEYSESDAWIFGNDTQDEAKIFAVNFYQCLMDTQHVLPSVKRSSFELTEDIGLRTSDYSNAGGGHYFATYRAFLVKDRFGNSQIVSLCIFGTDAHFRGEKRKSYTSLVVSVDKFKLSHNSLQFNIDEWADFGKNKISFTHNGRKSGKKNLDVINLVKKYGDGLSILGNRIIVGQLTKDKLFYLDDLEVAEFIYNLIEYGLLREEL